MASGLKERSEPVEESRVDDEAYARARERAEAVQGLIVHSVVYLAVNVGLFLINWVTTGGDGPWWFYWALLGWGIGLLIHVLTVVVPVFSPGWVERRARRMVERQRRG